MSASEARERIIVVRATEENLDLAREAVLEVNMPTMDDGSTFDASALAPFLADRSRFLFVAVEGKKAVGSLYGYSLVHPHRHQPQFFLYGIDVRPAYWNRGIGTALVRRFVEEARLAGAFEVWVITEDVNAAAIAMYARAGLELANGGEATKVMCLSIATNVGAGQDPCPPF
jgi:ribosomal protein S18 acetylase RimI-like enzyme